jgi:nitrate/nitrite transporter NarK
MKKHNLQLLCACLAGFAFSANYTNHAPLAAVLMHQFDFNKVMAGFLTTGIFTTHALMQVPAGHWADKLGGKKVLIAALTIVCAGNIGIAFAGSYPQLLLWKIFVGFGTGASFVSGARYIAQVMPAETLHKAQGYYGASVLLGSGFVIFAVPQIAQLFGWPASFLTTAIVAVVVLLLWLVIAPAPEVKTHPPVSLLSLLSHGQLWLLGFIQMASFGLALVIGSWITELLKSKLGLPAVQAGYVGSLVLLLGILTRIYGGLIVSKIGYRRLLIFSQLLNITGCFMLAADTSSFALALTAIVLIGIGSGLPYSALFNRAVAIFPGRGGAAMGLVNMLGIVMILGGAPLVGKIADWTGSFSSAFVSLGIFAFAAMLASLGIKKGVIRKEQ